jgi:hypothetical protein
MNGTKKQKHKMKKKANKPKKYSCIVKIGNNPDNSAKCVKYRLNDLLKFTSFLDRKYPEWRWMNVFSKETRKQLMSFTKYRRPVGRDG